MSVRSWFRGLFAAPLRMDDDGDEGAEAEAALDEEVPVAAEDKASLLRAEYAGGLGQGSKLQLEFDPKTIAVEGAEAEESDRDAEAEDTGSTN